MTTIKRVCKVLTPTVTQSHYLKRGNFSVCYELAERLVDFFEDIETGSKIEKMDKKRESSHHQTQCVGPPFLNVRPFKYLEGLTGFPLLMTSKCK